MRSAGGVIVVVAIVVSGCGGTSASTRTGGARSDTPTEAECTAVVDRLAKILPESFPDRVKDVNDCLALPKTVVDCLGRAENEDAVDACVREYCKQKPDACPRVGGFAPRPTEQECGAAIARALSLRGTDGEIDASTRGELIGDCRAHAAWHDVACTSAASDLNALDRCANDAGRANASP